MASNYDDVVAQLKASGLILDKRGLQFDRFERTLVTGMGTEKRGWYKLSRWAPPNRPELIIGAYGVFIGDDSGKRKIELPKDDREPLSKDQLAAIQAKFKEAAKQADIDRKSREIKAAELARKAWAQGVDVVDNQYLARKSVPNFGLRQDESGVLMVPIMDVSGQIHGVQYIRTAAQAEAQGKEPKQVWPYGLAMKGNFYQIGTPDHVVLICEGVATGFSLHAATGLPVVVAFNANNMAPVAANIRKRYKGVKVLICADDDAFTTCPLKPEGAAEVCAARIVYSEDGSNCPACGLPHGRKNTGVDAASAVAIAVDGAWVRPVWADEARRIERFRKQGHKHSDFNDLHVDDGLPAVRVQVEAALSEKGWLSASAPSGRKTEQGGGVGDKLAPIESLEELLNRFSMVYALGGIVFDAQEHMLVALSDMRDACINRNLHRTWAEHPMRKLVRVEEVGFDPAGTDKSITCNLWSGWPMKPVAGSCEKLLSLLRYMCSQETRADSLYQWLLCWLAYPMQHPGAKMKTALVIHGPQGTGKNMFNEVIMDIYGKYSVILDQDAIEDKFNNWASKKLFVIADEVLARNEKFHIKNKLKGFITGDKIRINPKGKDCYYERNQMNIVFLSNETMPVALEEDDRRHAVIWTPEKLSKEFYVSVAAEINNGGAAALYSYLLGLDLGSFSPDSAPPDTAAKIELINMGLDSPTRFFYALEAGDIADFSPIPARGEDYYTLYKHYCKTIGYKAASLPRFINALNRKHGVKSERTRYKIMGIEHGPHAVLMMGAGQPPEGRDKSTWIGDSVAIFRSKLDAKMAEVDKKWSN